jgi:D-serine deaminase-like pyridoxal phosphate-dependent protein
MELGATGVAVATAAEAECMLRVGISDVLITSALAPGAAAVAAAAAQLGRVTVVAGSEEAVPLVVRAAARAGVSLPVLVDIDVGQHRGGARDGEAAVRIAAAISEADELNLAGVQAYDGHLQAFADDSERRRRHGDVMAALRVIVEQMREAGFAIPWVTSAGTGTSSDALASGVVTEIQPGSYALMDHAYTRSADPVFQPAIRVFTSVIAVLGADEVIVDAGNRAVSTDLGPPDVAGRDATWELAGDEHGRLRGEVGDLRLGDVVQLIPSHADTTIPLYESFTLMAGDGARLPITRPR